jgi:SIR2-like domain
MTGYALTAEEPEGGLDWLVDPREPEAHLEVLARPEFVVPIIGAGISVSAGYPAGDGLAAALIGIGREGGLPDGVLALSDPRSIADVLIASGVVDRDRLLQRVSEIYDRAPTRRSATIDALLQVRSRRVVTLNYDRSLETRAAELGLACVSLVLAVDSPRVIEAFATDAEKEALVVVHAHGIASDSSTIVLDADGYSSLFSAPHVQECLWLLGTNARLLFMGTQLDELHILRELIRLRFLRKRHLLVALHSVAEGLRSAERSPFVPETFLVLVRGYDDHSDLVPLVELLGPSPESELVPPAPSGPVLPTVGVAPPDDYVETLMVEKREQEDDDFRASYLFALGLRPPVTLEQVAALGARTLIEGLPGSGKSTLLLEIGSRQPQQVVAVLVRAPQLDLVGDPKLLLARWLEIAAAFRPEEISDPARLDNEVFHFLIDALDEIPYPQQAHAVNRIIEVAAANPIHTFTVATRTIPAIEEFARPEWVRVVLSPMANWRQAYLEKRDVKWDQLMSVAPLLHDLRGLLDLPFFLSQTVDLYKKGALAETADLLALVGRFVDVALREIEETTPMSAVRPWLREVALAMLFSGRTDLTVEEIAASIRDDRGNYGDAVTLAERLVSAPLLRGTGDRRYGFVHRIFGEALAAEALLDIDPHDSGVLDVAAPVVTERIRGVRTDWLVPITLVAATSENWRLALAERDPLAAARAIPSDAPVDERARAARLIWDSYVEWRIWISDYQRMTIVEDESVVARLLGTEGLEDLHAEIRAAVSTDVRETRGNAIKVLATLGDRTIESQLRDILENDDDYVLRRMAAIAARDLKLDALFYVIAHRALHPEEETEGQDMTYAALDLATPDDLVQFALRAAHKGGTAVSILGYAIHGRISPRDELKVLRAWASHRAEPLSSERSRVLELLPVLRLEDESVAESVLFVAGSWRVESDELKPLVRQQPNAAARAAVELERLNAAYAFELRWILETVDVSRLVEAGASAEMLIQKEALDEWARRRGE